MRIVYIHQYFHLPSESGSSRSYEQARRLVSAGHDVHVISSRLDPGGSEGWETSQVAGIRVHQYPVEYSNKMSKRQRLLAFLRFAAVSVQRARSLRGDLVFASSTPLTTAVPGILASILPRRPFVFEVRDLWPDLPIAFGALRNPIVRWLARLLETSAYRHACHIVALSPDMAVRVRELSIPDKRVTVIPNASDVELFRVPHRKVKQWRQQQPWLSTGRPLAVYVGTIGTANRVDFLVEVAEELERRGSDLTLLVVGDGKEKTRIVEAAEAAGCIGRNLFFLGPVAKAVVPCIYGAADVVISSLAPMKELRSSSPNKVFDAFAAGQAVAINYRGWLAELIDESGAGIVTPFDAARFAEELDNFVHDAPRMDAARYASAALGRSKFNRDRLVNTLLQVLEQESDIFQRHRRLLPSPRHIAGPSD